jgi:co-chaperonin GroES (HSP10)
MIRPCSYLLLIKPDVVEEKTSGGLYVPVETKERKMNEQIFGTIIRIGKMAWRAFDKNEPDWEPWAKVGDRVAFAKYGGFKIEDPYTKEEFRLLKDEDVLAIVSEE